MTKLFVILSAQVVASLLAYLQLQGHYIWPDKPFFKTLWWIYLTSLPIAPLFFYATKWSYEHFGTFWNYRLLGFGVGIVVFGICTWLLFDEVVTLKTIISILLATIIIIIQIL
tara:strand:+ start:121 stop:459 length:339 start_codon:yes stop_codon:yes gene_type:complete